jgi:hypothetical protein
MHAKKRLVIIAVMAALLGLLQWAWLTATARATLLWIGDYADARPEVITVRATLAVLALVYLGLLVWLVAFRGRGAHGHHTDSSPTGAERTP